MIKNHKQQMLFIKDVEQLIGRNRLTLRRWWKKGKFPKPSLVNTCLAWRTDVIEEWINQHVKGVSDEL